MFHHGNLTPKPACIYFKRMNFEIERRNADANPLVIFFQ